MPYTDSRGFTYIELLVVLGLVGIIASFGLVLSMSSIAQSSVIQERDLFVTLLLRGARAEALANISQTAHSIHIDNTNHRYVLFNGVSFSTSSASNRVVPFTNESIIVSNTVGDTVFDITFAQLSGDVTSGAGTTTLKNGVQTQTININAVGQINW